MRIIVSDNVTLDGVFQSPGHPDEDRRGGFEHGGWAPPYMDEVMMAKMGEGIAAGGSMLFGRRTYEQFASYWPQAPDDNPFKAVLNERTKYVVSSTLSDPLPWENSVLLRDLDAVAALKQQPGGDAAILGSGELIRALLGRGLIDALTLSIHPLALGTGLRLLEGLKVDLELVDCTPTTTGVIIATYAPKRA
jgi:dihydrofolate reductase